MLSVLSSARLLNIDTSSLTIVMSARAMITQRMCEWSVKMKSMGTNIAILHAMRRTIVITYLLLVCVVQARATSASDTTTFFYKHHDYGSMALVSPWQM